MSRRLLGCSLLFAVVLSLAACGSGSKSTSSTPTSKPKPAKLSKPKPAAPAVSAGAGKLCIAVTDGLRHKILGSVVLVGARLAHVEAVASPIVPGFYFVSGTVDGSGTHNKVATWATRELDGHSPVYSVDSFAALISTYAAATEKNPDLSTKSPGSFRSRICAGGPSTDEGIPAPPSGIGNAPATG